MKCCSLVLRSWKAEFFISVLQINRNQVERHLQLRRLLEKTVKPAPDTIQKSIVKVSGKRACFFYPPGIPTVSEVPDYPTILYLHGGGYCVGGIESHERYTCF